jgi:hypothetical protein
MLTLIFGLIVGLVLGYVSGKRVDQCPKEIKGYTCEGEKCNHNKALVEQAKEEMAE